MRRRSGELPITSPDKILANMFDSSYGKSTGLLMAHGGGLGLGTPKNSDFGICNTFVPPRKGTWGGLVELLESEARGF